MLPAGISSEGSPPRGRRKVLLVCTAINSRITPAWAGKSPLPGWTGNGSRDHPRVGGEKRTISGWSTKYWGSPPRGRGKVSRTRFKRDQNRITPAWAGKSPLPGWTGNGSRDHPRVGGEKRTISGWSTKYWGSPPRGRGKVSRRRFQRDEKRITPAWAGKSRQRWTADRRRRDHPRVSGEKAKLAMR